MNYSRICILSFFLSSPIIGQPFIDYPNMPMAKEAHRELSKNDDFEDNGENNFSSNNPPPVAIPADNTTIDQPDNHLLSTAASAKDNAMFQNSFLDDIGYSKGFSPAPYIPEARSPTSYYADINDWDIWVYPNYFYLGYTGGRGIGYRRGYTTLGIFSAPTFLSTGDFQSFVDAKGYHFNDGKWAATAGGGTRYILSNMVVGLNIYYDYRRIRKFDLNQIGIGFELLSPCWDLRVNGYIPVRKSNFCEGTFFGCSGGFFAIRQRRVSTWYGVDTEIGTWLKRKHPCDWFGIYFAAGPYYYAREHRRHFEGRRHETFGGRARLLARICDKIDVSVLATYDHIWHTRVQGQITLSIPFDGKPFFNSCSQSCERCSPCLLRQIAIQPVQRNGIIVADKKCCWCWNWSDGNHS